MANARLPGFSQFAQKLSHCRSTEQGITVEQLASCMMESGFPAHSYRYQPPHEDDDPPSNPLPSPATAPAAPGPDDEAWLVAQLYQIEQVGDVSAFERDANTFIDALARCLPDAQKAADRLTMAWGNDEMAGHDLPPFL